MAQVELTRHLKIYFPQLAAEVLSVDATNVAEVVSKLEGLAPGFAFYVCDELGRLRKHVNIFVDEEMVADRRALGDQVQATSRVFIAQALSGG